MTDKQAIINSINVTMEIWSQHLRDFNIPDEHMQLLMEKAMELYEVKGFSCPGCNCSKDAPNKKSGK